MMTSKSDPRGHPGLKLCVHVSVMGYYRFINFHENRRGSGIFLGDFTWNDPYVWCMVYLVMMTDQMSSMLIFVNCDEFCIVLRDVLARTVTISSPAPPSPLFQVIRSWLHILRTGTLCMH